MKRTFATLLAAAAVIPLAACSLDGAGSAAEAASSASPGADVPAVAAAERGGERRVGGQAIAIPVHQTELVAGFGDAAGHKC